MLLWDGGENHSAQWKAPTVSKWTNRLSYTRICPKSGDLDLCGERHCDLWEWTWSHHSVLTGYMDTSWLSYIEMKVQNLNLCNVYFGNDLHWEFFVRDPRLPKGICFYVKFNGPQLTFIYKCWVFCKIAVIIYSNLDQTKLVIELTTVSSTMLHKLTALSSGVGGVGNGLDTAASKTKWI